MPRVPKSGPQISSDGKSASVAVRKKGGTRYPVTVVAGAGIELLNTDALKSNPHNARQHSETQVDQIVASIKRSGFRIPILIDENNMILAGHGRVMAANKMGMLQVPCIRASDLNEEDKRFFVLADNQIALNATWDMEMLTSELTALHQHGIAIEPLGFAQEITEVVLKTELPPMPDFGDGGNPFGDDPSGAVDMQGATPAQDGSDPDTASDEDNYERNSLSADSLVPHPEERKKDYHQLPPEGSTSAIKPNEERIPVGVVMNRNELDRWLLIKANLRAKSDKIAWQVLCGTRELDANVPPDLRSALAAFHGALLSAEEVEALDKIAAADREAAEADGEESTA